MNQTMLLSIIATGFTVAFFHAAIPTHWLPFVMAARAQKWSKAKTLTVTAIAGGGHVLFTTILGLLIVWLGIELDKKFGHLFPIIAGGTLIAFGVFYLIQYSKGKGHSHSHFGLGHSHGCDHNHQDHDHSHHEHQHEHPHDHSHHHEHDHAHTNSENQKHNHNHQQCRHRTQQPKTVSDKVAILSLLAMLTFSPCEGFLPVYLSGISYGWLGFVILSAILALGTLLGMMIFTWLTLAGMEKLKLEVLEKHETALMGVILCILGVGVMFFEH